MVAAQMGVEWLAEVEMEVEAVAAVVTAEAAAGEVRAEARPGHAVANAAC